MWPTVWVSDQRWNSKSESPVEFLLWKISTTASLQTWQQTVCRLSYVVSQGGFSLVLFSFCYGFFLNCLKTFDFENITVFFLHRLFFSFVLFLFWQTLLDETGLLPYCDEVPVRTSTLTLNLRLVMKFRVFLSCLATVKKTKTKTTTEWQQGQTWSRRSSVADAAAASRVSEWVGVNLDSDSHTSPSRTAPGYGMLNAAQPWLGFQSCCWFRVWDAHWSGSCFNLFI